MRTTRIAMVLVFLGALALQACSPDQAAAVATSVAATLQISQLETAAAGGGDQASDEAQDGGQAEDGDAAEQDEPDATATITPTPTQGVPMVVLSQATNCRSGPRIDYTYITAINAGQEVEVLKTFPNANYVVVRNPNGTGDCWLWLQYANETDFSDYGLPVATQPPTPTPSLTPTNTATATPMFVWNGNWTVQFGGASVSGPIVQTGNTITATFTGAGLTYIISGTLDATWQNASGTWDLQGGGNGDFDWQMLANLDQFHGNGNSGTWQFCGARNGAALPAPCQWP